MNRMMVFFMLAFFTLPVFAANYVIDTDGSHAFIQFRIKHLGFSWVYGRFDTFAGEFSYDETDYSLAKVKVEIDVASLNTNHAERDKHLRGEDFFDVKKFPKATFVSKKIVKGTGTSFTIEGDLTIKGVTKAVAIGAQHIGGGNDPWGGFRDGFQGSTVVNLSDFTINYNLGPSAKQAEIILSIEGKRL